MLAGASVEQPNGEGKGQVQGCHTPLDCWRWVSAHLLFSGSIQQEPQYNQKYTGIPLLLFNKTYTTLTKSKVTETSTTFSLWHYCLYDTHLL